MDEKLAELVKELQERVTLLEEHVRPTCEPLVAAMSEPTPRPAPTLAGERTTDRRELLARAATLTAGAVAGGTALAVASASPAAAAPGTFTGDPALTVNAIPGSGVGVTATTTTGIAVRGTASTTGLGVAGVGFDGTGVVGITSTGTGVEGRSILGSAGTAVKGTAYRLCFQAEATDPSAAHLRLDGSHIIAPPPGQAIARTKGEIVFDSNEDLWLCVQSGTPGVWRRVSGSGTAGAFTALAVPVRVYDSRPGYVPAIGSKTPLSPGAPRSCDLKANGSGVPTGASAVLVSAVATQTTNAGGGFLSIYRGGVSWPGTSNLNWSGPNENVAVTTLTAVDANATSNLYANHATHVVIDVLGYYR